MMVPDAINNLNSLEEELDQLLKVELVDVQAERLDRWYRRALSQLKDWGLTDVAQRFEHTYSNNTRFTPSSNRYRTAKKRWAILTALREDMSEHPEFYSTPVSQSAVGRPLISITEILNNATQGVPTHAPGSTPQPENVARPTKETVFLGHGRNTVWARVQLYLKDDCSLDVQAFESQSRAGRSVVEILKGFLNTSTFAVIVATAEDETAEGTLRARQNVIHEIGLFQGRLGFEKVALLQEEGLEEFSNIAGLQTIRFDAKNVAGAFYDLSRMLRRENVIS